MPYTIEERLHRSLDCLALIDCAMTALGASAVSPVGLSPAAARAVAALSRQVEDDLQIVMRALNSAALNTETSQA